MEARAHRNISYIVKIKNTIELKRCIMSSISPGMNDRGINPCHTTEIDIIKITHKYDEVLLPDTVN